MEFLRRKLYRDSPLQAPPVIDDEETKIDDSFTLIEDFNTSTENSPSEYIPFRFLENRIHTLAQTSVPHDLGRLLQHKENMVVLRANGDWDKLNAEQLNTSRTVQQLRVHLETIEELREQVRPTDLVTFDLLTVSLREDISSAVNEYHVMTTDSEMEVGEADEGGGGAGDERQSLLMARKKNEDHYQSLENLRMDLLELNGLVHRLNSSVSAHSQRVAMVNQRSESAAVAIHSGSAGLQLSQKLKAYVLPVGGAIVGGVLGSVVGGPVGAFAGLKIGALTAATASTAGALGGAFIGYRVRESKDVRSEEASGGRDAQQHSTSKISQQEKKTN